MPLSGIGVSALLTDGSTAGSPTTSDASGYYSLTGLAAGSYTLEFLVPSGVNYLTQWWSGRTSLALADFFTIADGASVTGRDAVLQPGASISGTVTGAPSTAISGADVEAYKADGSFGGFATTGASGHYSLVGLAGGSYTLQFFAPSGVNFAEQWWNNKPSKALADFFTVAAGATATGKDAVLAVGATISGTVTGAPSTLLSGVYVSAVRPDGSYDSTATSDASGHYSIVGLAPGSYTIYFFSFGTGYYSQWWNNKPTQALADYFAVAAGATVAGKDAVLALGATISGTITGAPGPAVSGVDVRLLAPDGTYAGSATSDSSGHYSIIGVAAGSYTLGFLLPTGAGAPNYVAQWWNNKPTQALADYFTVAAGATLTGKDAVLQVGATISGTVTGGPGTALAGARIDAVKSDGTSDLFAGTDSSGHFSIVGLPAGSYTLRFAPPSDANYVPQWWNNQPTQALADYFTVADGAAITGKDALLPVGSTISGHVTWPGGVNVGGMWVDSRDSAGNWTGGTYTGADGNYTIVGLPAGQYTLRFPGSAVKSGLADQWWSGRNSYASATFFAVGNGATVTGKDVILAADSSVSGIIRDSTGAALGDTRIGPVDMYAVASVYDAAAPTASEDSLVGTSLSKPDGGFTIPGLGIGTYKVQYSMTATGYGLAPDPSADYVPQWYNSKYSFGSASVLTVTATGQTLTAVDGVLFDPRFADVSDPSSSFYTYVEWMAAQNISTGTAQPSGKPLYKPVDAVSRQAMALFMYRLSGETFVPPADPTFADVGTGSNFYTAVEWMAHRGISSGTAQPSGKPLYKPTDPVSRQAMAIFLARYRHVDLSVPPTTPSFSDVATSSSFAAAIAWMKTVGISSGTAQPSGLPLYKPGDPVSRQAMAAFLYRLAHLPG